MNTMRTNTRSEQMRKKIREDQRRSVAEHRECSRAWWESGEQDWSAADVRLTFKQKKITIEFLQVSSVGVCSGCAASVVSSSIVTKSSINLDNHESSFDYTCFRSQSYTRSLYMYWSFSSSFIGSTLTCCSIGIALVLFVLASSLSHLSVLICYHLKFPFQHFVESSTLVLMKASSFMRPEINRWVNILGKLRTGPTNFSGGQKPILPLWVVV